jgi:hypothetical protein
MSTTVHAGDWQRLSAEGLAGLCPDRLPAAELLFLDGLGDLQIGEASCLLGESWLPAEEGGE